MQISEEYTEKAEEYKGWIIKRVNVSCDLEYLTAVYSFAITYPDRTKKE